MNNILTIAIKFVEHPNVYDVLGIQHDTDIAAALIKMSQGYTYLEYTGIMDGHHFNIMSVHNLSYKKLNEDTVNDMYKDANTPECISLNAFGTDDNSQDQNALIFYHKDDNDGVFSGAIMCAYCERVLKCKSVVCKGVDYNDLGKYDARDMAKYAKQYKYLVLTDISLPVSLLQYCQTIWDKNHIIWIDHHAPIIKEYNYTIPDITQQVLGIRDTTHSALYLAYQYANNQYPIYGGIPDFLDELSRWDSFTFKDDKNKEYCYTLNKGFTAEFQLNFNKVYEFIIKVIDVYTGEYDPAAEQEINDIVTQCYCDGCLLVQEEDSRMASIIKQDGDFQWVVVKGTFNGPKYKACALFLQGATNSTMFKSVTKDEAEIGIVFKHKADGNWTVSMYAIHGDIPDFHIGDWCKRYYNGGGHAGAGGFTLTEKQFIETLKIKAII